LPGRGWNLPFEGTHHAGRWASSPGLPTWQGTTIMDKLPIIDMDIHPRPHEDSPLEPHLPDTLREAIKQHMTGAPGTGLANPFGVWRRDAVCHSARQTAEDHLDKLGIAYAVIQPPGMSVSLTNQID